jgi:drug/metabolite transporter (DMT)-like permease
MGISYVIIDAAVVVTPPFLFNFLYMQKFISSVQVALILTLEPVFTAACDLAINDVRLTLLNAMGGGLILFAVVLSEFGAGLIPRIVVPNGKK